jgi:hypothetical protein
MRSISHNDIAPVVAASHRSDIAGIAAAAAHGSDITRTSDERTNHAAVNIRKW